MQRFRRLHCQVLQRRGAGIFRRGDFAADRRNRIAFYKQSILLADEAVAVGFIALAGVAAETGVVMLIYLEHAYVELQAAGNGRAAVQPR
jgi:hypothetical protein